MNIKWKPLFAHHQRIKWLAHAHTAIADHNARSLHTMATSLCDGAHRGVILDERAKADPFLLLLRISYGRRLIFIYIFSLSLTRIHNLYSMIIPLRSHSPRTVKVLALSARILGSGRMQKINISQFRIGRCASHPAAVCSFVHVVWSNAKQCSCIIQLCVSAIVPIYSDSFFSVAQVI